MPRGPIRRKSVPGPRPNRIAVAIVKAVKGQNVVRNVEELSDATSAAPGTLRSWCYAANIKPHDVVGFTRGLGAVHHAAIDSINPNDLLDFADKRSLDRFQEKAGPLVRDGRPIPITAFCSQQRFLHHPPIIADVIRLMSS